jgi:NADH-quinone oxidoreductase subunit K
MSAGLEVGLVHYLVVGAILFALGFLTLMTRRNAVGMLLGVELILNAAGVNFVAFSHYVTSGVAGQVFTVFIIILAASEAAIGLAVVLLVFRHYRTIDTQKVSELRQ